MVALDVSHLYHIDIIADKRPKVPFQSLFEGAYKRMIGSVGAMLERSFIE